ncbi:MAG: beta-ketoacyl-[acyl-carrier-protein] synthase family protein, partial [Thermoanaerobaculia bacterium]
GMSARRVVVTGLGLATALGCDEESVWQGLASGSTGIGRLAVSAAGDLPVRTAARVDDGALAAGVAGLGRKSEDRALDMALVVAAQALTGAGLWPAADRRPVATLFGTGMGPAATFYEAYRAFFGGGVKALRPTTVPRAMYNSLSATLSLVFGLTGPNTTLVAACASSTQAIGEAFWRIRDGRAERVLAGGAEAFFNPLFFGAWSRLGVLSRNPDPAAACRPFDRDRDGTVLGEGAAAVVLEELQAARARGARIRGEVVGFGESSDADHLTRPSVEGQAAAMREALATAGLPISEIAYVNAHGTATRQNDSAECRSLATVLGAAAERVPVGSSKSFFGHTLGAAGSIETVATLLALERGWIPPNLNLERPDPECAVRLVGATREPLAAPVAMKNSFGFGGSNAVLVLRRWES